MHLELHKIGAVITLGTSTKPIVIGYNTNKRTTFHVGTKRNMGHRVIQCSQHAEMSVVSQLIRRFQQRDTRLVL